MFFCGWFGGGVGGFGDLVNLNPGGFEIQVVFKDNFRRDGFAVHGPAGEDEAGLSGFGQFDFSVGSSDNFFYCCSAVGVKGDFESFGFEVKKHSDEREQEENYNTSNKEE